MEENLLRTYAGWLAKLVGIRLGAPIEGWTYERIAREIGEIDGYVADLSRFAADDDSNGPMIFIRALNDYGLSATAEEIGKTWLNYAPYEHGMFWWGGYGVSTEHTAYLNLASGIPAPRSGSILQNGAAVAEQIGGQIFIDTWGLVFPGDPARAAEYAARAASVSHGGNGIYGGMYVAAAIAMAFRERGIEKIVMGALDFIPDDCEYARVVRAVKAFQGENPSDWRACFRYVFENFGYDRYPGACHIIPNVAVMALSMLYGGGDFDRTLNICCMCGWDTDCNVGNVATIMGVMLGLEGIDYDKWLKPINDGFAVSSLMGSLNYMDVPWCARYLHDLALRLAEKKSTFDSGIRAYDFELPGSTHSFEAQGAAVANAGGCLRCDCDGPAEIFRRTYRAPDFFMDDRYSPELTPELYPGQRVTLAVRGESVRVRAFARDMLSGRTFEGEEVVLNGSAEVFVDIPALENACVERAGLLCAGGTVFIDEMRLSGRPDYANDFAHLPMERHHGGRASLHSFTRFKGIAALEDGQLSLSCADRGAVFTGDVEWGDYALEAEWTPVAGGVCELIVRAAGAVLNVAVSLEPEGILRIYECGEAVAEAAHPYEIGQKCALRVECEGGEVRAIGEGGVVLSAATSRARGAVGFGVRSGARMKVSRFAVRPLRA